MSILTNAARIGAYTSSNIWKLTKRDRKGSGWGAPALSYIDEVNMERRLGRPISTEADARALSWGKLLEPIAFERLDFDYTLHSQETLVHPDFTCWAGSPDGSKHNTVIDIKCPITLKSFCCLVDCINIERVRENHPDGEKYYWQLVSNTILTGNEWAELIVFMPYQSELSEVKIYALDADGCGWIANAEDESLPYLIEGGYYKNINTIEFEVPQSDKDFLTECVSNASKMLWNV
jgi:hypothetical protein